jgi:hypothetical protein
VHDDQRHQLLLRHRTTGQALLPLNSSALTFLLCPALFKSLCLLSPVGTVTLPILRLLETGRDLTQPRRYPRIVLGAVVIARQRWLIPKRDLPLRMKGELDFAYALRVERWRRQFGLPNSVFIRTTLDPGAVLFRSLLPGQGGPQGELRDQQRKPQYIDFGSPVLLRVFEKHLDETEELLLVEEMEPASSNLLPGPSGQPTVTEWLVEVSHVPAHT